MFINLLIASLFLLTVNCRPHDNLRHHKSFDEIDKLLDRNTELIKLSSSSDIKADNSKFINHLQTNHPKSLLSRDNDLSCPKENIKKLQEYYDKELLSLENELYKECFGKVIKLQFQLDLKQEEIHKLTADWKKVNDELKKNQDLENRLHAKKEEFDKITDQCYNNLNQLKKGHDDLFNILLGLRKSGEVSTDSHLTTNMEDVDFCRLAMSDIDLIYELDGAECEYIGVYRGLTNHENDDLLTDTSKLYIIAKDKYDLELSTCKERLDKLSMDIAKLSDEYDKSNIDDLQNENDELLREIRRIEEEMPNIQNSINSEIEDCNIDLKFAIENRLSDIAILRNLYMESSFPKSTVKDCELKKVGDSFISQGKLPVNRLPKLSFFQRENNHCQCHGEKTDMSLGLTSGVPNEFGFHCGMTIVEDMPCEDKLPLCDYQERFLTAY